MTALPHPLRVSRELALRLLPGAACLCLLALSGCLSSSPASLSDGLKLEDGREKIARTDVTSTRDSSLLSTNEVDNSEDVQKLNFQNASRKEQVNLTEPRIVVPDPASASRDPGSTPPLPVASARQDGNYPHFGDQPTAQTHQLSKSQALSMKRQLQNAGAQAQATSTGSEPTAAQKAAQKMRDDAKKRQEALLKQIEGG